MAEPLERGTRQRGGRRGAAAGGLALGAWLLAACSPEAPMPGAASPTPGRVGRFGSLRDFVLYERRGPTGGTSPAWFFLDRFEVTRADWATFANTPAGRAVGARAETPSTDAALPVGLVDLAQARAFAAWRFARLPRVAEWRFATTSDGRNDFPWGGRADATRANTSELGLGEPTPVGTFESGRLANGPYDLVGNVSEWTESVPPSWCTVVALPAATAEGDIDRDIDRDMEREARAPFREYLRLAAAAAGEEIEPDEEIEHARRKARRAAATDVVEMSWGFAQGRREALRIAALAVWQEVGGLVPAVFAVAGAGADVPREVVGADYLTPMADRGIPLMIEAVPAGDRRLRIGLRLATTPHELLAALVASDAVPTAVELDQLRRFVQRERHRVALTAAWPEVARAATAEQLARPLGKALAGLLAPRAGG
jgi:hypothetical protein